MERTTPTAKEPNNRKIPGHHLTLPIQDEGKAKVRINYSTALTTCTLKPKECNYRNQTKEP
jgi:hypothetical protein